MQRFAFMELCVHTYKLYCSYETFCQFNVVTPLNNFDWISQCFSSPYRAGAPLDPWMFPLHGEWEQTRNAITQPLLMMFMDTFQTKQNLEPVELFDKEKNKIVTLR